MFKRLTFIILTSVFALCAGCQNPDSKPDVSSDVFASIFEEIQIDPKASSLIIKRLSDNQVWVSNPTRAKTRYITASTSKIPHTLIALETKFAKPDTQFKWDGRERTFAGWNQDQTLRTAYRRSAVWVYQEIAQSLGPDVMSDWLTRFNYGNHDIGQVDDITRYWLSGPLKISAAEQAEFLTKLAKQELALSAQTYAYAWPIFVNETEGTHTLYAKTGWMFDQAAMDIGWFVGWVENNETQEVYVFAMNMDMPTGDYRHKRKPLVMDGLRTIGAWPNL